MNIVRGLQLHAIFRRSYLIRGLVLAILGFSLAACGGSDDDGGSTPNPPAPPPPPPQLPPLSSTVINIDDDRQIGRDNWPNGNTATGGQGDPIGTMTCLASQPIAFHVHTHLAVFLDGEQLSIPASVGFARIGTSTECHYPLHTHDKSGLIHVHALAPTDFTLGQFFQTWGQSLTTTDFAGITGKPIRVFVTDNAVVTEPTGSWADIQLDTHRLITVQIGTAITEIPNYNWTGN